jgi:ribosomal protein S12 methylthiotransferase
MQLQQEISKANLANKIGNTYEVLIENVSFDGKFYIGRTYMDVPDMDGVVFIENADRSKELLGKFANCKITGVQDYDLIGEII